MQVVCTLPHAGPVINGVAFAKDKGGLVSEDIGEEQAAHFLRIPGYEAVPGTVASLHEQSKRPRGRSRSAPEDS